MAGSNSGEGRGAMEPAGFSHPCTTCSGARPSRRQEMLPVPFQHRKRFLGVISCCPESSCLKLDQNKGQLVFIMKALRAKSRCLRRLSTNAPPRPDSSCPPELVSALVASGAGGSGRFGAAPARGHRHTRRCRVSPWAWANR